jgi:hypothetical protein
MVIENLIAAAPDQAEPFIFRTAGGAEIDPPCQGCRSNIY